MAIRNYAGDAAFVQRCQVHKIRNVVEHVPEAGRAASKYRMRVAYGAAEAADSRNLLYKLHDELAQSNPSAAASLEEGWRNASPYPSCDYRPNYAKPFPAPTASRVAIPSSSTSVNR